MVDDRSRQFPRENHDLVAQLCHRRLGIGADGLILLDNHPSEDFEMIYSMMEYNNKVYRFKAELKDDFKEILNKIKSVSYD